ncbi:uncharacterized protein V6R79_025587 [Siganus canaliculatus]
MMQAAFLLLASLTVAAAPSSKVCSYQDVLDYLNLTTDNNVFKVTRPVLDYTHATTVELDVIVYAILAVIEKTQTFIPFIWATALWTNEYISWDPADFCGITRLSIPNNMVWMPDFFIPEMIQKDDSPNNIYVTVSHNGTVTSEENLRVVSTCKMDVHKFPFDTQRCSITIGSAMHSVEEMRIVPVSNSSRATQFSRDVMRTQGEWEFLHLSVESENLTYYDRGWENLKYTITVKRRPLLHVINFLLPILFFLTLDLASFFIADHRGEKLSFKVTVLLAISVLLLILNDILPATSNNTPLIATYCIVIFALMLLSLLETILITFLMEMDSISQRKLRLRMCLDKAQNVNTNNSNKDEKRSTCCPCVSQVLDGEKPNELLPVAEQIINASKKAAQSSVKRRRFRVLQSEEETRYQQHSTDGSLRGFFQVFGVMLPGFLLLLLLTDGVDSERNCSYQDVLNHLQLTKNSDLYTLTRPVKHYKRPTHVYLEVLLHAILDVIEKDQRFIPYVWTVMRWHNEYISWDPDRFCGISNFSLPVEMMWIPDLVIEEMTEKDKSPESPYLTINAKGGVELHNDLVLVSTCRMRIYSFPFDTQRCNLSFKSVIHAAKDIQLWASDNSSEATEWSREVMRTQYEWLFINMTVTTKNASGLEDQDVVVYSINMKRRSILYVVNFLLPVLLLLCLDLASFLISDRGGEKLSFKVTVLIAITLLQLILNEILPTSSDKIPLIVVYCIGIFGLMLLSLLETIVIMYLIEKDTEPQDNDTNRGQNQKEGCGKLVKIKSHNGQEASPKCPRCIYDESPVETPTELLPVSKEGSSSELIEGHQSLEKLSDDLKVMEKTLSLLLSSRRKEEEEKSSSWTRLAMKVDRIFFIFYLVVISLFLGLLFLEWTAATSSAQTCTDRSCTHDARQLPPPPPPPPLPHSVLMFSAEGGESSQKVCSYQEVLNHLNLTKSNELFSMTRPVKDYKQPTQVTLEVLLYAILDVREIDQMFVPYVWIIMTWKNQHIKWNPEQFCGIENVSLPTDILWKPDITIEEMTEKDKAPPSPLLTIDSDGLVSVQNDQVLTSTCRMHVHKFPFDIQSCNLSFKSVVHSAEEVQLVHSRSSSEATGATMRTQYEWLFISMTVTNKTVDMFGLKQDMLVYNITMKRRSLLYVVNFLLPVLFFLCLDLASFLISESGGEKLSFKVTVMLAVTVMQLILNEILPASSDRIPLIVIYCIGIFALMMLSVMETILVMYLMEKDSPAQDDETDRDYEKKRSVSVCDVSIDETPSELDCSSPTQESHEKLSNELREVAKALALVLNSRKDEGKPGYWTKMTKTINRVFSIFYIIVTSATMSKNSKVLNLKDKINGNEMDLSLCNLTEVPVKELALFPKATVLDLSCNNITSLPPEFCSLTHLVKVDLSKNQLTCLPDDLGNLSSLQHLDLYNNKLTALPVSFSQLRSLKWLDLKDNPLEADLAKAAGDCLDEKQCKQCASKVLQHMRAIQEDVDRAREKRLLKEKALEKKKEAKQREREAREKEARKREKAEEKEKRRKEYQAQMAANAAREQQKKKNEEKKKKNGKAADKKVSVQSAPKPRRSCIGLMFKLLLLLLLGLAGVAAACRFTNLQREAMCVPVNVAVDDGLSWAKVQEGVVRQLVHNLSSAAKEFLESTQTAKS